MKKLLVVLLALVMVIAMATSAMAFTDTDDLSTVQQDSVYRLYALGILNGYPDGTFGADNQITRAEFAKIACIVAGFGDVSDLMSNTPSSFTDVAVGMWYTGYVNVAASQGYVHGYPDGTFKPNAPITMAEVVTVLMRIAGYNDNLPGPWPFDYIAQAGKEDVTDDVTFVSSVAATRADVAVMVNHLLDVDMVNYDNDISDFVDDEDEGTVLEGSFGAAIYDVMFYNYPVLEDSLDGWFFSDFDDQEISLEFEYYDDEYDEYWEDDELVMNENCYFAGGNSLNTIGGMQAEIIANDDDEVVYVKVVSTVEFTDDIEGSMADENLEVNGDEVDVVHYYAGWCGGDFNFSMTGYAKVFYNEDGDVYAVDDLFDMPYHSEVLIADSYDEDDEELSALAGSNVDLEDEDFVVMADGALIDAVDIEAGDVVYVLYYGLEEDHDYIVLLVGDMVEGTLTEGEDWTITVDDTTYNFDSFMFESDYSTEGIDGDYDDLTELSQLDDVFDADVQVALYRNPYEVAFLVSDVDASSSTVYGIVTDLTISGLFDNVTDVTILNQDGEEVTYDLDDDDIFTYRAVDNVGTTTIDESEDNIELGSYVEVELDEDGVITDCNEIILAEDYEYELFEDDAMDVSGSKIKINGTWYKVTDDTLFFEAVYDGDFYSEDFDEANLIAVDDILDADEVGAYVTLVSNDGGTLERLYLINSSLDSGNEGYSFVDRQYTNSSGDFVEMMDGTIAERDGYLDTYTFYAYNIVDGEIDATPIFKTTDYDLYPVTYDPIEDGYWVTDDGSMATAVPEYDLYDFIVAVNDFSDDTLTLVDEDEYSDGVDDDDYTNHYYTINDDTVIYVVDFDGSVDIGDEDDIEETTSTTIHYVGVISDEDGNALFVFVLPITAPVIDD